MKLFLYMCAFMCVKQNVKEGMYLKVYTILLVKYATTFMEAWNWNWRAMWSNASLIHGCHTEILNFYLSQCVYSWVTVSHSFTVSRVFIVNPIVISSNRTIFFITFQLLPLKRDYCGCLCDNANFRWVSSWFLFSNKKVKTGLNKWQGHKVCMRFDSFVIADIKNVD